MLSIERIIQESLQAMFRSCITFTATARRIWNIAACATHERGGNAEVFVFDIKKKFRIKLIKQIKRQVRDVRKFFAELRLCPICPFLVTCEIGETYADVAGMLGFQKSETNLLYNQTKREGSSISVHLNQF